MKPQGRNINAILGTMKKAKANEKVLYINHTIQHEKTLFLSFSSFNYRYGIVSSRTVRSTHRDPVSIFFLKKKKSFGFY